MEQSVLIDEVQESEVICATLEGYLTMAYALVIRAAIPKRKKYDFAKIVSEIDEDAVMTKWREYVKEDQSLKGICPLYMLKYECLAYRDTVFKSKEWYETMEELIRKIGVLQERFY